MSQTLTELRQEIDAIDMQLHDLIMQRASVVEAIRTVKPAGPAALRPAREAQILRRLMARHHGSLPAKVVIEFWQVILGASTCLQGDFTIACTPQTASAAFARFGQSPAFAVYQTDEEVINHTLVEPGTVALLPWPSSDHDWWGHAAFAGHENARRLWVTSCFPLMLEQGEPLGLIIAGTAFEPSGDDFSLIVTTAAQNPFDGVELIAQHGDMRLFRIASYIAPDDARLDTDTILLGGYPKPLSQ